METYALALTYAIPVFLFLIAVEALISERMGIKINRGADMIASLSSGITNVVKDVLGLTIVIISYAWLVERVAIFEIRNTWYVYIIAFMAKDFASYWIHRLEHTINFAWNRHIIHHSSEEFNLSCALRQSITEVFSYLSIFLLPAALLGVPADVIAVVAPIHLFIQFWYHTRLIKRMGWLEYIIVTPSHHRVHHAINPEYIDKNYGQVFIIWDKLFGTFQPELEAVPAVYGVKRPVSSWNPFVISLRHVGLLMRDAWHTSGFFNKLKVWFMPTGWRPADVAPRMPVNMIENVYDFEKYDTNLSKPLLTWSWIQMSGMLALLMYFFTQFGEIGFPGVLLYGLFVFAGVFSMTALMDKAGYTWLSEVIRLMIILIILYSGGGDWFGLKAILPGAYYLLLAYLITTFIVNFYFQYVETGFKRLKFKISV